MALVMTMTDFVNQLRVKGWTAQELAKRWGVTPRQLSRIAAAPKQIHWDALSGIPDKNLNKGRKQ